MQGPCVLRTIQDRNISSQTGAMSWLLVAVISLSAAITVHKFWKALQLQHIPGPRLASFTNLWLVYSQLTGRIHLILHHLIEQHGPVARIAPNWVVCGDPTEIQRIWAVKSPWTRGEWYRGMRIDPYRDSSFSTRNDDLHKAIRRKLLPGYSGHDVDNVDKLIDEQVQTFVDLIDVYITNNGGSCVIDIAQKVQYFALDTISALAFGDSFGFLKQDEDKFRYIETTGKTVYILVATALIPGSVRTMQSPYLKWIAPSIKNMAGIGDVIRFAERAVAQRFGANRITKRDMLGSFVKNGLGQKMPRLKHLCRSLLAQRRLLLLFKRLSCISSPPRGSTGASRTKSMSGLPTVAYPPPSSTPRQRALNS